MKKQRTLILVSLAGLVIVCYQAFGKDSKTPLPPTPKAKAKCSVVSRETEAETDSPERLPPVEKAGDKPSEKPNKFINKVFVSKEPEEADESEDDREPGFRPRPVASATKVLARAGNLTAIAAEGFLLDVEGNMIERQERRIERQAVRVGRDAEVFDIASSAAKAGDEEQAKKLPLRAAELQATATKWAGRNAELTARRKHWEVRVEALKSKWRALRD